MAARRMMASNAAKVAAARARPGVSSGAGDDAMNARSARTLNALGGGAHQSAFRTELGMSSRGLAASSAFSDARRTGAFRQLPF